MPKRKCAISLKHCCSLVVATNINNYYNLQDEQNAERKCDTLNINYSYNPFEKLVGLTNITEDLIAILQKKNLLRCHHLKLLLSPNVRKLKLSGWSGDYINFNTLLTERCQKLTHLDIGGCCHIPQGIYMQLVECLPNVITLNLEFTQCSDQVLRRIGKYCKNLRELNVTATPISDLGITSLCFDMDELEDQKKSVSNITKLIILETEVTNKGAMCALKSLPHLIYFYYVNSLDALTELHKNELDLKKTKKYKLSLLSAQNCTNELNVHRYFEISCSLCPYVKCLKLVNVAVSDDDLLMCAEFQNITTFQLHCGPSTKVTFYNGITAFLQMKGNQITTLDFGNIDIVNMLLLGQLCPNLELLSLHMIQGYDYLLHTDLNTTGQPFSHLKELGLIFIHEIEISAHYLKTIISEAKNLQIFHVHNSENLTDDLIREILIVNPLKDIKNIVLELCSGITGNIIRTVLEIENCLTAISCFRCKNFTQREFQGCRQYIKEQNLDVRLQWLQ